MSTFEAIRALSDEARVRLARALVYGSFNVQELTRMLKSSQSTVSHHLKILQQAQIVDGQRSGTATFYALKSDNGATLTRDLVKRIESDDPKLKAQFIDDERELDEVLNQRRDRGRKLFDQVAAHWREMRASIVDIEASVAEIKKVIKPSSTVLELGCGSGGLLEQLLPRDGTTIGVDSSQAMLDEARKSLGKSVDLRLGYLEHLPLGDASVDVALAHLVFHFVSERQAALRDCQRVLKTGGKLLLIDYAPRLDAKLSAQFGDVWQRFTIEELVADAKSVKFSVTRRAALGEDLFLIELTK